MRALIKIMPGKEAASVARGTGMILPALVERVAAEFWLPVDSHGASAFGDHAANDLSAGMGDARVN